MTSQFPNKTDAWQTKCEINKQTRKRETKKRSMYMYVVQSEYDKKLKIILYAQI